MPDALISTLLAKAKSLGGPIAAAALIGLSVGWYAHGERTTADNLASQVSRLDSGTVKRPEFDRLVVEFRYYAARGDSTNALLRRFICRSQPTICP
jgi:hypothetical protein